MESLAVFMPGPKAIHRLKRRRLRWFDFARYLAVRQRITQQPGDINEGRGRSARAATLKAHAKVFPSSLFPPPAAVAAPSSAFARSRRSPGGNGYGLNAKTVPQSHGPEFGQLGSETPPYDVVP